MAKKKADPMRTKTGKQRLGPLSYEQLTKLAETGKKKDQAKVKNRMRILAARPGFVAPVQAVVEAAE